LSSRGIGTGALWTTPCPACPKQVRRLPSHGGAYSGIPGRRVLLYADHWDPFDQSSDYSQCRREPPHQLCPAHALCHPSEPLAEADAVFQIGQQKTVRLQGGALVRYEARPEPAQAAVLTVTGLLPNLCKEPTTPASQSLTPRAPPKCLTPKPLRSSHRLCAPPTPYSRSQTGRLFGWRT
jgi:hypothetical protein